MCGIFGWSIHKKAKIGAAQREALATVLALGNNERGDHSWGAYTLDREGKAETIRQVGSIAKAQGIGLLGHLPVVMAHTRYATTGKVTAANQHPFKHGSVLLAHNGVIFNHERLNETLDRKCAVDSEHIAMNLAEGKDLSDIEGYGAIEWVLDDAPGTVRLCRLESGSLSIYGIEDARGKRVGVVWSSDEAHLEAAIGAARLDAFPYEKPVEGQVYYACKGKLFIEKDRKLAFAESSWDRRWTRVTSGLSRSSRWSDDSDFAWRSEYADWREEQDAQTASDLEGEKLWVRGADGTWSLASEGTPGAKTTSEVIKSYESEASRSQTIEKLRKLTPVGNGVWVNEAGEEVPVSQDEISTLMECDLSADLRECPGCGEVLPGDANFCPFCGHDFDLSERLQAEDR